MSASEVNQSVIVLANAIDLATRAVLRVAGTNSANTADGAPIMVSPLCALVAAKLQRKLLTRTGVVNHA